MTAQSEVTARLLGESPAMRRVREQVRSSGALDTPVLIEGEAGTGKRLVALAIHQSSPRCRGPFQVAAWKRGRYQSPFDIALEHAALGDVEQTLVWLDRSFAERETDLIGLAVDPRFDALRGDPRFRTMLVRLHYSCESRGGSAAHTE